MTRTTKSIQADTAKGAFRPHTALSTMALAYYQQDSTTLAKNMFPVCPVGLSSDNYYVFDKEDLLRDNWQRKPAYGKVDTAVISEHTETPCNPRESEVWRYNCKSCKCYRERACTALRS